VNGEVIEQHAKLGMKGPHSVLAPLKHYMHFFASTKTPMHPDQNEQPLLVGTVLYGRSQARGPSTPALASRR